MIMTITKNNEGEKLTISIEGRLDTSTAPQLESELKSSLDGVKDLIMEVSGMEYISSAGLRVLLSAQKTMNKQGKMVIRGANDSVMEIFDVTGFIDILTIE
jgi:anti-sigma B factor antagonist